MSEKRETKELKIIATERTTRDGAKTFTAYKAVQADGRLMTAKFTQDCPNVPKVSAFVTVPIEAMNISRSKEYPELWIREVVSFIPVGERNAEREAQKAEEVKMMF